MIFVCDAYNETKWYWDGERYIRLTKDGEKYGDITPDKLPDPFKLWQARAHKNGTKPTTPLGMRLKPQESTFKLWEHRANLHHAL